MATLAAYRKSRAKSRSAETSMLLKVTAAKPRSRAGAERQEIGAAAGFAEAFPIAGEHLEPGEQIVRPEDGLRAAHMGVAGDHGIGIPGGEIEERAHHADQEGTHGVRFLAQPEPRIERHLFVAAAAGVDLVGHLAGPLPQFADDQSVHVFVGGAIVKCWSERLDANAIERRDDLRPLLRTQNADALQGARECLRAADVGVDQAAVEIERSAEALEDFARPGFKAPAPELHTDWPPRQASATFLGLLIGMSLV